LCGNGIADQVQHLADRVGGFRRALSASSSAEREPGLRRYWRLLGEVTGEPVTVGTAICWLVESLDSTLSAPV
jgi:hypothetical protein